MRQKRKERETRRRTSPEDVSSSSEDSSSELGLSRLCSGEAISTDKERTKRIRKANREERKEEEEEGKGGGNRENEDGTTKRVCVWVVLF